MATAWFTNMAYLATSIGPETGLAGRISIATIEKMERPQTTEAPTARLWMRVCVRERIRSGFAPIMRQKQSEPSNKANPRMRA